MSFQDALAHSPGAAGLAAQGIVTPTAVQEAVWEPFLQKRDLLVQSGTGTGKTLAYLLPLMAELQSDSKALQALILAPTQELAIQILRQMELVSAGSNLRALALVGGVNLSRQIDLLKSKPQWAVATPGRVVELLQLKKVTGHYLSTIVLDEADRLLDTTTRADVRAIFKSTLKSRRAALFSASLSSAAAQAAAEFVRDPVVLTIDGEQPIPASIQHGWLPCPHREKADLLRKVVHALKPNRALVFQNRPEQIEMLADKLRFHGLSVASLHGSLMKLDRQKALEEFRSGKTKVLVCSDLAARGLDLPDVELVVQFDVPEVALDYQHRCGRTGRAGRAGLSLSFADEVEAERLKTISQRFSIVITEKNLRQGNLVDRHSPRRS